MFSGDIQVESRRNGDLVKIRGLNYHHFKLFGLSVLWRAGVAAQKYFKNVTLGPHEEPLRKLVLMDEPGRPDEYGFFLSPIVFNQREDVDALMVQPTRSRLGGHLCYRFVFGGLAWVFIVSSHKPPEVFRRAFVNPLGEMLMLVSELRDLTFIARAMRKIGPHPFASRA